MTAKLSLDEARTIAVGSQGLHTNESSLEQVFSSVKCVQLDPLRAIRPSHELVCLSRGVSLGGTISLLSADTSCSVFAYPGHAMALLPMKLWPSFAFMRRRLLARGWRGPVVDQDAVLSVRSLLNERSSVTTKDFTSGSGSGWNRVSQWRIAADWLLWTGEAVSTSRKGSHREYALASGVVPVALLTAEPSDEVCLRHLVSESLDALGVATTDDIADYFRLHKEVVERILHELNTPKASVEGWAEPAWLSTRAESVADSAPRRVIPLSPFDSLVWYRPRLRRLFGKVYSLEAYKPAAARSFGHYFIPILSGNNIIGRVSPRRRNGHVVIEALELDDPTCQFAIDEALVTLREWSEAVGFEVSALSTSERVHDH